MSKRRRNRVTASNNMVDLHVSTLFQSIQDDTLTGDAALGDIATPQNLQRLKEIGKELLKKTESRVNFVTGAQVCANEVALTRFSQLLSEDKSPPG